VLFDLDGTLVDTAEQTQAAIIETLAAFDRRVTVEQIRANGGSPLRGWFSNALGLSPDTAEKAYRAYVELIKSRASLARPMAGAEELLVALRERRMPLAVVTNRLTEIALPILEAAGWLGSFAAIVGQEVAARTKPSADPAIYALESLEVEARDAAFVGDSEADMACGAAAGIRLLIGLEGETPALALRNAGATHVCANLIEVQALLASPSAG
jgi:HAD superfamily hydrolase (TIGR01549 family)